MTDPIMGTLHNIFEELGKAGIHAERIITTNDPPPIPLRNFDWSAWIDGREEWLTGRGRTEAAAIEDLREQIEEEA